MDENFVPRIGLRDFDAAVSQDRSGPLVFLAARFEWIGNDDGNTGEPVVAETRRCIWSDLARVSGHEADDA
jgi:hypothetical protein